MDLNSVKNIGEEVKATRKQHNMTQDELAKFSKTGRRFVSDLEKGKETLHIGKVLTVLAILGIAVYAGKKASK